MASRLAAIKNPLSCDRGFFCVKKALPEGRAFVVGNAGQLRMPSDCSSRKKSMMGVIYLTMTT